MEKIPPSPISHLRTMSTFVSSHSKTFCACHADSKAMLSDDNNVQQCAKLGRDTPIYGHRISMSQVSSQVSSSTFSDPCKVLKYCT